jgi:hypothetical protein
MAGFMKTHRIMDTMQPISTVCFCQRRHIPTSEWPRITLTEVVGHEFIVLKGMLSADGHDGLVSV